MQPAATIARRRGRGDRLKIKGRMWFLWLAWKGACPCRVGLSCLCGAVEDWLADIDWNAAP